MFQLTGYRPAVATMSLGSADHNLESKLYIAARTGFEGIELYWDDLTKYARELYRCDIRAAAASIGDLSHKLGLSIISIQPFRNYDGIISIDQHNARLDEFREWMRIATLLGTNTIGVPATIDPTGHHIDDTDAIISDMCELADLAATANITVAYENLCFSAVTSTWQDAYNIVQAANRPNLVFLPDTFNICGSAYANPACKDMVLADAERTFKRSMAELSRRLDLKKVQYIQVADGERLEKPIGADHEWMQAPGVLNPRMAWSRNARLFPLEEGGFLPLLDVLRAVTERGRHNGIRKFGVSAMEEGLSSDESGDESDESISDGVVDQRMWISIEVFTRSTKKSGDVVVYEHAMRAWNSWLEVQRRMGW